MYLYCKKCLGGRTGDVLCAACQTPGCDGVMEEMPAFNSLVNELPEPMTCGRRFDQYAGGGGIPVHRDRREGQDRWQQFKSNGNRVCSFCGSLHPDDFFFLVLVKLAANAPADALYGTVPEIEPSDKGYKIYVQQPGVRNAMEGGIKFYKQHLPSGITKEQEREYAKAVAASERRLERHLASMRQSSHESVVKGETPC